MIKIMIETVLALFRERIGIKGEFEVKSNLILPNYKRLYPQIRLRRFSSCLEQTYKEMSDLKVTGSPTRLFKLTNKGNSPSSSYFAFSA